MGQIVSKPVLFHTTTQKQLSRNILPHEVLHQENNPHSWVGSCIMILATYVEVARCPHICLSVDHLYFKLDYRVIIKDFDNNALDVTTGELASYTSTNLSKMNKDFVKSASPTKVHLNVGLTKMPYIPVSKIKTVIAPMNQLMVSSCYIYGMNIVDKKIYILQKRASLLSCISHYLLISLQ